LDLKFASEITVNDVANFKSAILASSQAKAGDEA
jgi:hypothetical protein